MLIIIFAEKRIKGTIMYVKKKFLHILNTKITTLYPFFELRTTCISLLRKIPPKEWTGSH